MTGAKTKGRQSSRNKARNKYAKQAERTKANKRRRILAHNGPQALKQADIKAHA